MNSDNAKKSMTDTEVMIGELNRVIAEELAKDAPERDDRLIDECIKEIAELKGVRAEYSKEEIGAMFEQLEAKASAEKKSPARSRRLRRPIAAACAVALFLVCGVATVAWNPNSVVRSWINEIIQLPVGTSHQLEDITYSHQDNIEIYSNIEKLTKKENLNIYYPSKLPDDVYITRIDSVIHNNTEHIIFKFTNPNLQFNIQLNSSLYFNNTEYETLKIGDLTFYLSSQNNYYVARTIIDSNLYLIESSNYDDIIIIINNFSKG